MGREIIPYPEQKGKTTEKAARLFGVNEKYVRDVKRIKTEMPVLMPQIRSGAVSIPCALRRLEWMKSEPQCESNQADELRELLRASEIEGFNLFECGETYSVTLRSLTAEQVRVLAAALAETAEGKVAA